MPQPDHVVPLAEADTVRIVEPSYPTTEGLPMRTLRRAVEGALERLTTLPEWASPSLVAQRGWPSWDAAVRQAHAPGDAGDLDPASPARARLAYDEILSNQLALTLVRARMKRQKGRSLQGDGRQIGRAHV